MLEFLIIALQFCIPKIVLGNNNAEPLCNLRVHI